MPLKRAEDTYAWNGDVALFPMTDGKTRIVWRISREALKDRALADGNDVLMSDLEQVFLMHRVSIEQIASDKHDNGHAERLVVSSDLNSRA